MSEGAQAGTGPRIALVTYSTKPRGGVVHALSLGEALQAAGERVHVFALGQDRFYRDTTAPYTLFPAPEWKPTLEQRVFASIDALAEGLAEELPGAFDVVHVQDCIAARAATAVRDAHTPSVPILRTVHHIDDFSTEALVECQHRSVREPDVVLAVSQYWRAELAQRYDIDPGVVHNGVDTQRFGAPPLPPEALRARVEADRRFVFLAVGGLEPRKGSYELVEALGRVTQQVTPPPLLVVLGGHSFQDHRPYRDRVLARAHELGLDHELVVLGTVTDDELISWYHAADALAFPSIKEGWGLAVLEAMAAGLPVVASDIPVFREYLTDGDSALLPPVGDVDALTRALHRMIDEPRLRRRLAAAGREVAARFSWDAAARQHRELYRQSASAPPADRVP